MTRSSGPWSRTAAVGNRSTPAFVLAAAVAAAGGLWLVGESGIEYPQRYLPLLGLAAVGAVGLMLLKNALGWAWSRAPRRRQDEDPLPSHALVDARAFVAELCAGPQPDIPRLVEYLLHQAIGDSASDIHIVPYEGFVLVRFRVDGILTDVAKLRPQLRE